MADLIIKPNISHSDDFYAALVGTTEELDQAGIQAFNARLILILANHIGDANVLLQALNIAAARDME